MAKIRIIDTTITETSRTTPDKNGKYRVDRTQPILLEKTSGEVLKLIIELQPNQSAYAPGNYFWDSVEHYQKGKYGRLEFEAYYDIKLTPVSEDSKTGDKPLFGKAA